MKKDCRCALCVHWKEFERRILDVPPEHQPFFRDLYDRWTNADFDLQWFRAQASPEDTP